MLGFNILTYVLLGFISHEKLFIYGPQREKTCLRWFANTTGADQPAHLRSLISAFVSRILESTISKLATSKNFNSLGSLYS